MNIITTIGQCQSFSKEQKKQGKIVGVVPTMGALHQGHLQLFREAKRICDVVIVTLFLNPKQFGENEDLSSYPVDLAKDKLLCCKERIDVLFIPTVEEIYNKDFSCFVQERETSLSLCGKMRPHHFDAVSTIVTKLFNITLPDKAFFGKKDYQQLFIIKRLVRDLNFPIEVIGVATYREEDGLAYSSRNSYLSGEQREAASCIYALLCKIREKIRREKVLDVEQTCVEIRQSLNEKGGRVDYVEIVDCQTLQARHAEVKINTSQLLVAVFFGKARLIDNIFLGL